MAKKRKKQNEPESVVEERRPGEPLILQEETRKALEEKTEFAEPEIYKSDIDDYPGDLDVDLDRVVDGKPIGERLSEDIARWLEQEIENHRGVIEKLSVWDRQYRGIKKDKNYPYPGAHNTSVPITRILTDAIMVRVFDVIWGQKKLAICTPKKMAGETPEEIERKEILARQIEDAIDWWQRDKVQLKKKLFPAIMQAIKTGAGYVKLCHITENKTIYRYASPEEVAKKVPGLFRFSNGQWGIKKVITSYEGPTVLPISREDFIFSSDATSIDNAFMVGFRTYLRRSQLELRSKQGIYYKDAVNRILNPDEYDETKKNRAEGRGLKIDEQKDEYTEPYEIWELWLKYDVDGDGEEDDIVITYHLGSKTILRAKYNPLFMGFRPFVKFEFLPVEYSFEGEGTCQILEKLQLEIDALHNARLDRLDQINAPITLVREGSGLENVFQLAPGSVWITHDELNDANMPIKFLTFPEIYPQTFREEAMLIDMAQQALGISPAALGQSMAERPVAKETYQLIQEMNKKFKFGQDNIRMCVEELLRKAVMMMAQYQPRYEYEVMADGRVERRVLDFPFEFLQDAIDIRLTASSELMNIETRRENNLIAYQLVSDFDTKIAGMAQVILNPQTTPEMKQMMLDVAHHGYKLLTSILEDIGRNDAESIIPNLRNYIRLESLQSPPPQMSQLGMLAQHGVQPMGGVQPVGLGGGVLNNIDLQQLLGIGGGENV